jgi:hypothetical protein
MAGIFGGSSGTGTKPSINPRIQTSVQGRPRAIGAGLNRFAGNVIWNGDFKSTPASQGGKGAGGSGKGSSGSYTYSVSFIVSFGETLAQFNTLFNGNQIDFMVSPSAQVLADLAALGITPTYGNTYGGTYLLGDYAQAAWSYLTSAHPSQALAYRGEAIACFANLGLGSSPSLPNFTLEGLWPINTDVPALGPDANPADWVTSFLSNGDWGAGFPVALLGDLTAYRTWCRATGLMISPVLTDHSAANSHLSDIMKGTIADFRWSSGLLTIVPYGDTAVTGNGYTFTPATTPIYAVGPADYLENQGSLGSASGKSSVAVSRKDPAQILNRVQVEYLDRSNLYNPTVLYDSDDASIIASKRLRLSDLRAHHFFCLGGAASMSAALQLHREKVVATYQFTLPATFILVDPLDILTITEPNLGLVAQPVRVIEIVENSDHTLTLTAEEFLGTVSSPLYARQMSLGAARNNNVTAGNVNAPILFEPTSKQSYAAEVWGAVSGSNPALYGGCEVWVSYDNATYTLETIIPGVGRTGSLTGTLPLVARDPSGTTPDNSNTLAVDLTESAGALASGSAADLAALNTVCYVDGEIIAYQTATLSSAYHYNVTTLLRGVFGTPISQHVAGGRFARLDGTLFKIPYTPDRIGATLYLKFLSFNIYGAGKQSLGAVSPYTYTIIGTNQDQLQILNTLVGDGPGSLADALGQMNQVVAQTADASVTAQNTTKQQLGQNAAAVITEQSARVTAVSAQATALTQAIAQFNSNFASSLLRFDVLATDNLTYATLAMMVSVGNSLIFAESGIRIAVTLSGGVITSQMQLLTQNLIITDGTHTAQAFSFDATSGALVLNTLRFQQLFDIAGIHVSINGNTGAVTFSS